MASWNSTPMEVTYEVLGWIAFVSWSISFCPQVILNFRRNSVVGLNFDFVILNLTKHSSYLIYNATLYFSSAVQKQYFHKYGSKQMIPVAANDVAFSSHAVLLTALVLIQIAIYERGNQKVSKISIGIVVAVWLSAAVCFFIALSNHSWLWLICVFNLIQVCMTAIKYIPQAIMNFMWKSTDGYSIGNILLDFTGGLTNYAQMAVQSIDQHLDIVQPPVHVSTFPTVSCQESTANSPNGSTSEERTGAMGKSPDHHHPVQPEVV
ncbi:hypothetical protein ACLB2K_068084 [Fragaria x ananassa]